MFRVAPPRIPLQEFLGDEGKAEGFVFACDQKVLYFGHDRREPVATRPVVSVRRVADRRYVLPCTSKAPSEARAHQFFPLENGKDLLWQRSDSVPVTYAYWRGEVVRDTDLHGKIGVLSQNARVSLYRWLQTKQTAKR